MLSAIKYPSNQTRSARVGLYSISIGPIIIISLRVSLFVVFCVFIVLF